MKPKTEKNFVNIFTNLFEKRFFYFFTSTGRSGSRGQLDTKPDHKCDLMYPEEVLFIPNEFLIFN